MRVLIAGLGAVGQRHIRNLKSLLSSEVDIVAYRVRRLMPTITPAMSTDEERNVEKDLSIRSFSDLDDALATKPEVAFICNPTSLHLTVTQACLGAGCDVFVEKPLSTSLVGAAELIRTAEKLNRITMVGYQYRFHPCLRRLADTVKSGALGNLLSIRATIGEFLPKWHSYEDYRRSYAARADLGGGVVLTQIHEFDYLYSLLGLPVSVYAIGGHWSDLEVDVEDTASTLMNFRVNGRSLPVHLHQDYLQWPPSRQCEVIGDRGKAVMDLRAPSFTVFNRDSDTPEMHSFPGFERNQLFLDELSHFLDCVKSRRKPVVDLMDGLQSLRMALAARKSMQTQMTVEMKYFDLRTEDTLS